MPHQWHEFPDRQTQSVEVARTLGAGLSGALAEAPVAGLVAAGGTTAPPVLEQLAAMDLDWSRVRVTVSDERWVNAQHEASNERMVRDRLLRGPASRATFIPIYSDHPTPEAAEPDCHARLAAMPWRDSLCMLGMGNDGHAASLFPGTAALTDALDVNYGRLCKAVRPQASPIAGPHPRMSLTLMALMQTRHIHLVITGAEKRATFERALHGTDEREMPVRAILRQTAAPVSVYWSP
jgi:6-phosphogluconolactonase